MKDQFFNTSFRAVPELKPEKKFTRSPAHKSIDESRDLIKNVLNGEESYAICLKENGKPFRGRGIMTEAVREILRHAFEDCGMKKVWCGYYEGNIQSKRVQEKCGFVYQQRIENADVPLLHEKRTECINLITKKDWLSAETYRKTQDIIF